MSPSLNSPRRKILRGDETERNSRDRLDFVERVDGRANPRRRGFKSFFQPVNTRMTTHQTLEGFHDATLVNVVPNSREGTRTVMRFWLQDRRRTFLTAPVSG